MKLSKFGEKLAGKSGINLLMDDLGKAMAGGQDMLMLGGGNPGHIPAVQERFRDCMKEIMEQDGMFERILGNYDTPQGHAPFLKALASLLRDEFGWEISPKNIALTNGSQSAFFILFNMFAGEFSDGSRKKILLPLAPEYIGYVDAGIISDFFIAGKPDIEFLDDRLFKYHVNFDNIEVTDEIGAICLSRPTNPTGNVVTNDEIDQLVELSREHDVPLILDNAYGTPFPNIIFNDAQPVFNEHTIVSMSLSKLGLPSTRTGIVIAQEEVIASISRMTAVMNLSPGSLGAAIATQLCNNGELIQISQDVIKPFYQKKAERAVQIFRDAVGAEYDIHIHKPEGALFLWLWFRDLPISSMQLYERLKQRGVLVVSGHYFFPGLQEDWQHKQECLRVTYSMDDGTVEQGLKIIAEEAMKAYDEK